MALFEVPTRPGRETDADIAKKLKTKPKQVATRSTGVVGQIQNIRSLVLKVFGGKEQYCKLIQTEEELKDYVELICRIDLQKWNLCSRHRNNRVRPNTR